MSLPQQLQFNEEEFLTLLTKFIGYAAKLQNKPPQLVPQEDLPASDVCEYLKPFTTENGGPLSVRKISYAPNRSNVIITYPGTTDKVVSFVGSHMDVVPANPEDWTVDPFSLTRDGDKLYGRGVTDCLGHVAMLAQFFKQLAIHKPVLKPSVVAVFIANEENSDIAGVGVDELEKRGELKHLKNGPLYWVDSANIGPTLGTGGMMAWSLTARGKLIHSGLPHQGINGIELVFEAIREVQRRFHEDFAPREDKEGRYLFNVGSSMKPTQVRCAEGGLNQIPAWATVEGDVRFTPFYSAEEVKAKIESYVADVNANLGKLPTVGFSKYELPQENLAGKLELKWLGHPYQGVAVNLDSVGYKALHDSIAAVRGKANPFSLTGSLPIIRDLQDAGYDVQVTGFGKMEAYHARDEYGYLSDFQDGFKIVAHVIHTLNESQ